MTAAWTPCPCCENFICTIHQMHAHDCPCPPVEEWLTDPYTTGGPAECSRLGCHPFPCDGDLLPVQMRSQATGPAGPNKFDGPTGLMCASCRKANRGGFKIVR